METKVELLSLLLTSITLLVVLITSLVLLINIKEQKYNQISSKRVLDTLLKEKELKEMEISSKKEDPKKPKILYKKKLGTIIEAIVKPSKASGEPILTLSIETSSFKLLETRISKLYTSFALNSYKLRQLEEATKVSISKNWDKNTLEELMDKKVRFEVQEDWYQGTPRAKIINLYRP